MADPLERQSRPPQEPSPLANPVTWLVVAIVAATGAGLYWWKEKADRELRFGELPVPRVEAPPQAPPPPPAAGTQPEVLHPLPEQQPPQAEAKPLPPLDQSDEAIHESLAGTLGKQRASGLIITKDIARRVVATIDNLPRHKVAARLLPVRPVAGQIVTSGEGDLVTLSPANYVRYAAYVRLARGLDAKEVVALYVHFYPLFQEAYEELGYPRKYFNDRLLQAIDDLLAAPDVPAPVKLVRPKVLYEFEDAELEDLSAGQKILIRIGPENAAVIKAKLRDIRHELAAEVPAQPK